MATETTSGPRLGESQFVLLVNGERREDVTIADSTQGRSVAKAVRALDPEATIVLLRITNVDYNKTRNSG